MKNPLLCPRNSHSRVYVACSGSHTISVIRDATGIEEPGLNGIEPLRVSLEIASNPVIGRARFVAKRSSPKAVCVEIYNLSGRVVRTLVPTVTDGEAVFYDWDCLDCQGERVGRGAYVALLKCNGHNCGQDASRLFVIAE